MRFIDRKGLTSPEILQQKQADTARAEVDDFISQTVSKGGTRRVPRSDWLDENAPFQENMAQLFEGCCAYCERETRSYSKVRDGLIGRHRPSALAQDEDGNTELLAYAWVMYDWENLLWICNTCARRKGNLFYIEADRGLPSMSVSQLREVENELMLDPCFHDPSAHLTFHLNGTVNWISPAGHATATVLDLNQAELVQDRRRAVVNWVDEQHKPNPQVQPPQGGGRAGHSGATFQALNGFCKTRSQSFDTATSLVVWVARLNDDERNRFLDDVLTHTDSDQNLAQAATTSIKIPSLPSKPKAANRIPDVSSLPNALQPITRVKINNFKALRDIQFDLPTVCEDKGKSPCMLLLGENAMGKSSVLEAMALAVIGANETAALNTAIKTEEISPRGLIHRPDPYRWHQTAPDMAVQLDFLDSDAPVLLSALAEDPAFSGTDHCAKVVLGYGPRRFFTSRKSRRMRAPAHRVRSLFDPMAMIANPIYWLAGLKDPEFFAAARALREVLMLADDDDFERDFDPETPGQIYIQQNGQRVAMKDLSVGFKSVIAMVCDIIRELLYHFDNLEFASAVVFIDEIETHLHPRWKMQIMTLLRRAFPKIQFIVTTHDPLCLRGMFDGEVFVLQRSPSTDKVERLADLPSLKGMRAEQILTSEFFGLGSTDPKTDARLMQYNRLASKIETLSDQEQAELERLRRLLEDGMVIGTTLREQAYAEALKERNAARSVVPTRVPSPRRALLKSKYSSLFAQEQDQ